MLIMKFSTEGYSGIRVLVVDDEASVRKSLASFLEDCDFSVVSYQSGDEALQNWESQPCDIAIVDMRLGGMAGEALIMKLYEMSPTTRFLIYTGSVNYRLSADLEGIGIKQMHVLKKPLEDLFRFVEHIRALLEEREDDCGT